MSSFLPAELIKKKRRGEEHSREEIDFLVQKFTSGELPDYQMSAWLMAVVWKGLSSKETSILTDCMRRSGEVLDFSQRGKFIIDKHSTGGVGDKTSLILAPLVACADLTVPMMAGRGLGHTGGTLDKLEAISGMNVRLSLTQFRAQMQKMGVAIVGQTKEICPADMKLYSLRDVTGTVDSIPLICASIMSKKLAEGLNGLVLDVKYGNGAFMKTMADARALAMGLGQIGSDNGIQVRALLTNMNQPLGTHIGNALEVEECVAIMKNESSPLQADTRDLTLDLAAHMFHLAKIDGTLPESRRRAEKYLESGQALEKFHQICSAQGATLKWQLPKARHSAAVVAPSAGFVSGFATERVGLASLEAGAGRRRASDSIDYTAGFVLHAKIGSRIEKGQLLAEVFGQNQNLVLESQQKLSSLIQISPEAPMEEPLVAETLLEDTWT